MKSLTEYINEAFQVNKIVATLFYAICGKEPTVKDTNVHTLTKEAFLYNALRNWIFDEANIKNLDQAKVIYGVEDDDEDALKEIKDKAKDLKHEIMEFNEYYDMCRKCIKEIEKNPKKEDQYWTDKYFYDEYWDVFIEKL